MCNALEMSLNMAMRSDNTRESTGITRQIADAMRDEIIYGRLEVGQRLPTEEELAMRFGASQPTVREAMKLLAAQHLIHSKRGPGGGVFVNRPTLEQANSLLTSVTTWLVTLGVFTLDDIAEARRGLGHTCIRLATQRRGDRDITILARELRRMSDSSLSNQQFCAADEQFHRAIANATGNKVLQLMMLIVSDSLMQAIRMIVFRFHEREAIVEINTRILGAIRSRRSGIGEDAFGDLMDYLLDCYEDGKRNAGRAQTIGGRAIT